MRGELERRIPVWEKRKVILVYSQNQVDSEVDSILVIESVDSESSIRVSE